MPMLLTAYFRCLLTRLLNCLLVSLNTLLLINFIDLHLQEISTIILLANINITDSDEKYGKETVSIPDPVF